LRRKSVLVLVLLLACAVGFARASSTSGASRAATAGSRAQLQELGARIAALQRETWRWQRLMGLPPTETEGRTLAEMRVDHVQAAVELWGRRAAQAQAQAAHPPHLSAWLCIHRYEGSWTDTGAPYYGGLQMDVGFQRHYGADLLRSKGTADRWTPLEQIWVAERARRAGRGFYPWPNTARACGLI
jgi:hypothetical protein